MLFDALEALAPGYGRRQGDVDDLEARLGDTPDE
jgi:hypothetical protein